jgi:hypothetical protein
MLDGEPLDPIEIELDEGAPQLPTGDLSDIEPLDGIVPPSTVDDGDFYWHFDEQIDLQRKTGAGMGLMEASVELACWIDSREGHARRQ